MRVRVSAYMFVSVCLYKYSMRVCARVEGGGGYFWDMAS